MQAESTSVLVIGGSLVGLSAALFLSHRGVKTLVVEKHRGTSLHPRAIGFTPRTLELIVAAGVSDVVPKQIPANHRLRRTKVESLAGKWFEETAWTPAQKYETPVEYSPYVGASIAQDRMEPLLFKRAVELGAEIRQAVELCSFTQDAQGVTAVLRDRNTGKESIVRAAYMIAADGSISPIREALGIKRRGRGHIRTIRSVLFRAPLDEYLQSGMSQFEIEQPNFKAFLTTYQDGRWVLMFEDDVQRSEGQLAEAITRATGRKDLPVEIITTGRWELSAWIAERYSEGRVFLAGDAAHTLPPTRGGYGANTGIDDAHNLAWKLAAVLSAKADPLLLETYNAERQPIGWLRHQQTFVRPDYAAVSQGIAEGEAILPDAAMEFGQLYRSTAVFGSQDNLPAARKPEEWQGQPGTRAPHVWITQHERRISTLDLFQKSWVLLINNEAWAPIAARAAEQLGIEVEVIRIGKDIQAQNQGALLKAFGMQASGASLIRPDGYIAWRCAEEPSAPERALTEALARTSAARARPK